MVTLSLTASWSREVVRRAMDPCRARRLITRTWVGDCQRRERPHAGQPARELLLAWWSSHPNGAPATITYLFTRLPPVVSGIRLFVATNEAAPRLLLVGGIDRFDMGARGLDRALGTAVANRLEQRGMLVDRHLQ